MKHAVGSKGDSLLLRFVKFTIGVTLSAQTSLRRKLTNWNVKIPVFFEDKFDRPCSHLCVLGWLLCKARALKKI